MGRYEDLSTTPRIVSEFLDQFCQKVRVQLIFGPLDGEKRMRLRIMKKEKVRKHLNRSVAYEAGDERIPKCLISKAEE